MKLKAFISFVLILLFVFMAEAFCIAKSEENKELTKAEKQAKLIKKLNESDDFSEIEDMVQELAALKTPEAIDALIETVGGKRTQSFHATRALESIGVERAYDQLIKTFAECSQKGWRGNAHSIARAIGATKAPGAYQFLMEALSSQDEFYRHSFIRAGAAIGLGHLGDRRAVPTLIAMIKEGDTAGYGVSEALVELNAKESTNALLEAFQDRKRRKGLRAAYVEALSHFDDRRAIPLFIEELEIDLERGLTVEDEKQLKMLKKTAAEEEEMSLHRSILLTRLRMPLIKALVKFNDPRAIPVMGKTLLHLIKLGDLHYYFQIEEIAKYLSSMPDDQAVRFLVKAFKQLGAEVDNESEEILEAIINSKAPSAKAFWGTE